MMGPYCESPASEERVVTIPSHVQPSPWARHWRLDPEVVFLNHGSFGACPIKVQDHQTTLRAQLESSPVRFMVRELPELLANARSALGRFVGASPDDLALVSNATAGVNTVLRALNFGPDDELLVTDHEYNACRNALDFVARRSGARVVVVSLPFPVSSEEEIVTALCERVTKRTRLCLVDHVTSPTGLVLPIQAIVDALNALGVDTLVDGAHAPGMVPLNLEQLGAAYYTGNCHKWCCTPKGAAMLYVRSDRQSAIRPLAISHGANMALGDGQSRYRAEFDWTGTTDPTAWLCIPKALEVMATMDDAGWPGVMAANRRLALDARNVLCEALNVSPPCPESMIGSLAAIALPPGERAPESPLYVDPLHDLLFDTYGIEVPIIPWPRAPQRLIRVAAQRYNDLSQYEHLAKTLTEIFSSP
jgi:isopenicillin-N epimerase